MDTEYSVRTRIASAYRSAKGEALEVVEPIWLEGAIGRIAERLILKFPPEAVGASCLENACEVAGHQLRDYQFITSTSTRKIWGVVDGNSSRFAENTEFKDLHSNRLPSPLSYLLHSPSVGQKSIVESLERSWYDKPAMIQEDYELRRAYGGFVCRFAIYEFCDRKLRCLYLKDPFFRPYGGYALFIARMRMAKTVYIALASTVSASTSYYLSQSSDASLSILVGLTIFFALFSLIISVYKETMQWGVAAISDVAPLVALEDAIKECTSSEDLVRCVELAQALFCNGYIESKYVINIIKITPAITPRG